MLCALVLLRVVRVHTQQQRRQQSGEQCGLPPFKGDTYSLSWPLLRAELWLNSSLQFWGLDIHGALLHHRELCWNEVPLLIPQDFEHRTDEAALGSALSNSPRGVTVGMVSTAEPSCAPASKPHFFLHFLCFHCATMTFGTSILGVLIFLQSAGGKPQ